MEKLDSTDHMSNPNNMSESKPECLEPEVKISPPTHLDIMNPFPETGIKVSDKIEWTPHDDNVHHVVNTQPNDEKAIPFPSPESSDLPLKVSTIKEGDDPQYAYGRWTKEEKAN